jgi:S-DNA-T family DNA segregation ATPase FtsK/SpoIIIE
LRKGSLRLVREKGVVSFNGITHALLDPAPSDAIAAELAHQIGQASIDSNRVQVPFSVVAPKEMWSESTTNELRIAVGRTGATKLQYLAIGKGTRQHALLAGKTGSGKSTLLHIIITNLALTCSPDEVEFYLIDFKKGVEFKCYADAKLPHAKVIAIESDREFALSVLQRIDEELKRRGEMFASSARRIWPATRKPAARSRCRAPALIDEFQEFFVEDDSVAQGAALLLDRIVRQGRAFGIHVFLGSQTLGGAYTLARTTLGADGHPHRASSATRPMPRSSWMTATPRRVALPAR